MKPGYKQTDVGLIPEEWELRGFLTTVHIASGQVDPRNEPFKSMTLVAPDHIESGTGKLLEKQSAAEQRAISGKYIFAAGDIVYSKIRPYLRKAILADFSGLCSADMYPLKPGGDVVGGFMLPLLLGHRFTKYAESVSVRSGMPKINRAEMAEFVVALPPPPEQRAIAETLSDGDGLLGELDRLIAKKRHLKQAAMQQLLTGQTRLSGFHSEWQTKRLAELLKYERPDKFLVNSTEYLEKGDIPVLTANKSFILGYTNDEFGIYQNLPAIIFDDFTTDSKYVDFPFKMKSSAIKILTARSPKVNLQFISARMHLINFPVGEHKRYYISEYQHIELPTPESDEQTAIAEVLTDMDAELALLKQRRQKIHNLKQAMMQELLTGRIRLVLAISNVDSLPRNQKGAIAKPAHNWQINEAVIIGVLAGQFGTEEWPLPRKRQVKLAYLLHRHVEGKADGYLKKAAGPYNPKTKYQGPEGIALKNRYIRKHNNGTYVGFVAAEKIAQAEQYFSGWYPEAKEWLEQFRFEKTDELELLATIDMAVEDLRLGSRAVALNSVKDVIRTHPEWQAKLSRPIFSDDNITRAIDKCSNLFAS